METTLSPELPTVCDVSGISVSIYISLVVLASRGWGAAAPARTAEGLFGERLSVCSEEAVNDLLLPWTLVLGPRQHHGHRIAFQLFLFID